MALADRLGTITEVHAALEDICTPRRRRFTVADLERAGIALILYPLSAFRAMSKSALSVYETIIESGTQAPCLPAMQTREELYRVLGYYAYEKKLDTLFEERGQVGALAEFIAHLSVEPANELIADVRFDTAQSIVASGGRARAAAQHQFSIS